MATVKFMMLVLMLVILRCTAANLVPPCSTDEDCPDDSLCTSPHCSNACGFIPPGYKYCQTGMKILCNTDEDCRKGYYCKPNEIFHFSNCESY